MPNIEPLLISDASLVYHVHDRPIEAVEAVRDRGEPLAFAGNFADYDALAGAGLSGGQYATCLAQGLLRIHSLNDGSHITCDIRGDIAEEIR